MFLDAGPRAGLYVPEPWALGSLTALSPAVLDLEPSSHPHLECMGKAPVSSPRVKKLRFK